MKDIIESPATGAGRAIAAAMPMHPAHDPQECDGHQEGEIQNAPAVATTCRGQSDETVRPSGASEMKDIIEFPATGADRAREQLTPSDWTHDPQECDGQKNRDNHFSAAVATTCRARATTLSALQEQAK